MTGEIDRLRLARSDGVGPITYRRLLRRYRDPAEALAALPALASAGGRATPLRVATVDAAERELARTAHLGARLLFLDTHGYPPLLALLDDAPPVIAVLGDVAALVPRAVAMVGSRNASANGQRMAETLAAELAGAGLVVVSGLARGIDAAAHLGALRSGVTVACIAGGLDMPYRPEHAALQARIAATGGAVVAEMPPGTTPQARLFLRRNRIIAGLSLGVVVVEAAMRSGALVTARVAHDLHRDLFAVPGSPLDPRCRGTNDLLRQGATLTETAADVLGNLTDHPDREGLARDPLFVRGSPPAPARSASGGAEPDTTWPRHHAAAPDTAHAHATLLELLSPTPTSVDDLLRRCQLSAATIMSALLDLELAGRVEALPGNRVALVNEPEP